MENEASASAEKLITLLSNRAAALLRLSRWAAAARDCDAAEAAAAAAVSAEAAEAARRGVAVAGVGAAGSAGSAGAASAASALRGGLLKVRVRGAVARLQLGEMAEAC